MNWYISILILVLIFRFLYSKNYNGLIVLITLSLLGNMFYFNFFGSRILVSQLISLLFAFTLFKKKKSEFSKIILGIRLEYIVLIFLGLLYGFIIPWDDFASRSWNQNAGGRSIVALFRIFSELVLVYCVYYIFISNKQLLEKFLNILSILVIVICFVAFIDFFTNYTIFKFLFNPNELREAIVTRFLGFNHEPRALARTLTFAWFFLIYFKLNSYKIKLIKTSLFFGFVTILLSFSFSSYFIFSIGLVLLFRKYIFKKPLFLILITIIIFSGSRLLKNNEYINTELLYRLVMVLEGRTDFQMYGEPAIFTRFEVFDRAALNFFYNNPIYIFLGTGPNLISIPSSKYLDRSGIVTFEGKIVGIPGFGIINLISRSGLLGLFLYCFTYFKILKILKNRNHTLLINILQTISVMYIFISSPWFYFTLGFVLAQSENFNNKLKNA